jgi:hypothetical protein
VRSAADAQEVVPSPALARQVLEGIPLGTGRGAPRSPARRASGILSPGVGLVKSREKIVDQWPQVADRLITELR